MEHDTDGSPYSMQAGQINSAHAVRDIHQICLIDVPGEAHQETRPFTNPITSQPNRSISSLSSAMDSSLIRETFSLPEFEAINFQNHLSSAAFVDDLITSPWFEEQERVTASHEQSPINSRQTIANDVPINWASEEPNSADDRTEAILHSYEQELHAPEDDDIILVEKVKAKGKYSYANQTLPFSLYAALCCPMCIVLCIKVGTALAAI